MGKETMIKFRLAKHLSKKQKENYKNLLEPILSAIRIGDLKILYKRKCTHKWIKWEIYKLDEYQLVCIDCNHIFTISTGPPSNYDVFKNTNKEWRKS